MPSIEDLGAVRSTGSTRFYKYTNEPVQAPKIHLHSTGGRSKRTTSGHHKSADGATRQRAVKRRIAELERENYNEQHLRYDTSRVDIIASSSNAISHGKRRPTKAQNNRSGATAATRKILASRKTLSNLLDDDPQGARLLSDLVVRPPKYPVKTLCSICGYQGVYSCTKCGLKYCSLACDLTHKETRCLKLYG